MEENNNNVEANNGEAINSASQGSYITGTIGAIIGGAIASLPWVLVYVYGNMIVAILAILIALGAFYGYKLAKGKMGKGLPAIIAIVSVAIIVILTTIVCPLVIISKEANMEASFKTIKLLYENKEVASAIMQDALISIVFTIVGIAGIIKSMHAQIKSGSKDVKFSEQPLAEQFQKYVSEQAEETKKAFESLGAMNKENTAEKKEIINELVMTHNVAEKKAKANFQLLYNNGIIKKSQGKYYYDLENENSCISTARQTSTADGKKTVIISLVVVFVIIFVIAIAAMVGSQDKTSKVTIPNTNIEMKISSDLRIYDTKQKIKEKFGEDYSEYYDFAILDKDSQVEVYGVTMKKSDITGEYTLQEIAENNKTFADTNYKEVTPIETKKLGKVEFKYYTYQYGEETTYLGNLYVADTGDRYLFIDCYADLGNQSKIDSVMKTLFK
jgi:hypothetical protein